MYNCARLHTLFDSYERGVENGEICADDHNTSHKNPRFCCINYDIMITIYCDDKFYMFFLIIDELHVLKT